MNRVYNYSNMTLSQTPIYMLFYFHVVCWSIVTKITLIKLKKIPIKDTKSSYIIYLKLK